LTRQRGVLLLVGAAVLFAAWWKVPLCPFAMAFGIPCPGCGLSRAAFALLRGDLHAALAVHPLSPIALPATFVLALHATSERPAVPSRERLIVLFSAALLVLLVAVWLARFAGAFGGPAAIR
jgi:hypothetical protein